MDGSAWRDGLATAGEICGVLGDGVEAVARSVLALAPTRAELLEAQAWLTSGESPGLSHAPGGKVALICKILKAQRPAAAS